jgi:hypothetical protein
MMLGTLQTNLATKHTLLSLSYTLIFTHTHTHIYMYTHNPKTGLNAHYYLSLSLYLSIYLSIYLYIYIYIYIYNIIPVSAWHYNGKANNM